MLQLNHKQCIFLVLLRNCIHRKCVLEGLAAHLNHKLDIFHHTDRKASPQQCLAVFGKKSSLNSFLFLILFFVCLSLNGL